MHASALELYKPALTPLLFPVFAHCVLALCRSGEARAAAEGAGGGDGGGGEGPASGQGANGAPPRGEFLASARAMLARHGAMHREHGFADLRTSALKKCAQGLVSLEEVNRVTMD